MERDARVPIFLQGEHPLGLWMIESGELRISRGDGRGRTVMLEVLEAGDLAGLAPTVSGTAHETEARTGHACRLRLLLRTDLLRLMNADKETGAAIATLLAIELATTQRWIGNTVFGRSGAARLAKFVLLSTKPELARLSHTEVAKRVGLSRETVSRLVRDLRQAGALFQQPGPIRVRNRSLLEKITA
jgi:CRP-like cAMP-binding protein